MYNLIYLINLAVDIYIGIIIVQVAVSWLIAFDVINAGNKQAQNLIALLRKVTDPVIPVGQFKVQNSGQSAIQKM